MSTNPTPPPEALAPSQAASMSDLASQLGKRGGTARAVKLSPERRREIARAASFKRWAKTNPGLDYVVFRNDCEKPFAAFSIEAWAEQWVSPLCKPRSEYRIISTNKST
jgi:hypothetical protein